MKTLIKFLMIIFCLSLVSTLVLYVLSLWDIYLISWVLVGKILLTIGAVTVITTLYGIIVSALIKRDRYRRSSGKAHQMR